MQRNRRIPHVMIRLQTYHDLHMFTRDMYRAWLQQWDQDLVPLHVIAQFLSFFEGAFHIARLLMLDASDVFPHTTYCCSHVTAYRCCGRSSAAGFEDARRSRRDSFSQRMLS